MKACFPIVGEKEYKDSTSSTKRRQCVFTKLRVESVYISFVSLSFNKPHVSVPMRTSIRASEIRVPNKFAFYSLVRAPKTVSATPRTKIRESEIRVQKIFVSFALFVFKITRVQNPLSEICVQ